MRNNLFDRLARCGLRHTICYDKLTHKRVAIPIKCNSLFCKHCAGRIIRKHHRRTVIPLFAMGQVYDIILPVASYRWRDRDEYRDGKLLGNYLRRVKKELHKLRRELISDVPHAIVFDITTTVKCVKIRIHIFVPRFINAKKLTYLWRRRLKSAKLLVPRSSRVRVVRLDTLTAFDILRSALSLYRISNKRHKLKLIVALYRFKLINRCGKGWQPRQKSSTYIRTGEIMDCPIPKRYSKSAWHAIRAYINWLKRIFRKARPVFQKLLDPESFKNFCWWYRQRLAYYGYAKPTTLQLHYYDWLPVLQRFSLGQLPNAA